ncbi:hypothetical protein [Piscinibacter gummiphilus]|uniref:Uncharacterized protein n=1 Tax=Piscinibacter gummiphilus TaxID=946333 RepID=A0ABZ0D661_9BURK|nr:hypothetical protein [Piscinibacter gummiphilus]WOB10752.1 hypothetical protein RXV79_12010 [Piscinibacter gummiphilus]
MASAAQVKQITELAGVITDTPIRDLVSQPAKWGSINFEGATTDLELIFGLCKHLKELPIEILPPPVADSFTQVLGVVRDAVAAIKGFSLEMSNPAGQRDSMVQSLHGAAEQLLMTVQSWIAFLAYQKGDVQKNIEALSSAVGQASDILDDAKGDVEQKKTEIAGIVTAAREASASAGVGVFTSDFAGEATSLEDEAKGWLKATGGFAAATMAVAVGSGLFHVDPAATNAQVLQFMTSKIVLLVALLTATIWCGRLYKATKHQASSNRHRANSLKTFQAFIKAASDDATRNAVLIETTRSIFAASPSGYLETSEPAADTSTKVLEIIKGSASAKP